MGLGITTISVAQIGKRGSPSMEIPRLLVPDAGSGEESILRLQTLDARWVEGCGYMTLNLNGEVIFSF